MLRAFFFDLFLDYDSSLSSAKIPTSITLVEPDRPDYKFVLVLRKLFLDDDDFGFTTKLF